jgi:hypothetical protein
VTIVDTAYPDFGEVDALQAESGAESPREWSGDAVYLRLEADRLFTYAREPERYPR